MHSYQTVDSQQAMDQLVGSIAGFHDSMTKEIHLVNRGYVQPDRSMIMSHQFDAQILIQSQCEPFAIELLCIGIEELATADPGEYWDGAGTVTSDAKAGQKPRISMTFADGLRFACRDLRYRVRPDWLGKQCFLNGEVPSDDTVAASSLEQDYRQCSSCCDAWKASPDDEFSLCPSCGRITQLECAPR
jgi:hypothetical protein